MHVLRYSPPRTADNYWSGWIGLALLLGSLWLLTSFGWLSGALFQVQLLGLFIGVLCLLGWAFNLYQHSKVNSQYGGRAVVKVVVTSGKSHEIVILGKQRALTIFTAIADAIGGGSSPGYVDIASLRD